MNLLNVKKIVTKCLEQFPICRENDNYLVSVIWKYHLKDKIEKMDALDVLVEFSNDRLPSYDSITRCRRKLQQIFPHLRGKNYELRNNEQENVKRQIKNFI